MSRWACDVIIHSHSQVFIILCALTVKPPALLFCLVIHFYPTVYKTRNINQRLHHPANTEKWKQLSQPIIQKAHGPDDAGSLTVWSYFYHGMKRPFNWAWNVLFVLCVLKIFSALSQKRKNLPMTPCKYLPGLFILFLESEQCIDRVHFYTTTYNTSLLLKPHKWLIFYKCHVHSRMCNIQSFSVLGQKLCHFF